MNHLPRLFMIYNTKGMGTDAQFPDVPIVPWVNCGMGDSDPAKDEQLRLPHPSHGWTMFDREDPEHYTDRMAWWWTIYDSARTPTLRAIAYDPFKWSPDRLRVAGWWTKIRSWAGLGAAAEHMRSRRAMERFLEDYDAIGTDVYHHPHQTWEVYAEQARLKLAAHLRLCVEWRKAPVVCINLDRDIGMQSRIIAESDKRIRWGMWQDPTSEADAIRHGVAAQAVVALVSGGATQ